MGKIRYAQEDLNDLVLDVNSITAKEWDELRELTMVLLADNLFKGDAFKCGMAALALLVSDGRFLRYEDDIGDPDNDWLN